MRRTVKYLLAAALLAAVAMVLSGCSQRTLESSIDGQAEKTAAYIRENVSSPVMGSVGGEWAVLGIAESGTETDQSYFDIYYDNIRAIVKSSEGVIHDTFYTDYARVTLALCAIDRDPSDVEGYDLTQNFDRYDEITWQGANAVAYTLIAANVSGTPLRYEDEYLSYLIDETGKYIEKENPHQTDYVSMGLAALSFYGDREEAADMIDRAASYLSTMQGDDGSMGNCESTAEAIMALSQSGVDVFSDERFIKNGVSLGESLMIYSSGDGGFRHAEDDGEADQMATEKALIALDSMKLFKEGGTLYEKKIS